MLYMGGRKGKTTMQTKHADPFKSNTPGSPASFPPVFPFNEIVVGFVTINSASLSILSTSSAIVDECEGCVFTLSAITAINESILSAMETIASGTAVVASGAQIIVSDMQTIVSIVETVISGDPQNSANDRVADGSAEIIISELETTVSRAEAVVSVLQITVSEAMTVIAERVFVTDGSYTVVPGPQSVIYMYNAALSVVGTIISETEISLSKAEAIISAVFRSFCRPQIVICTAEKTVVYRRSSGSLGGTNKRDSTWAS